MPLSRKAPSAPLVGFAELAVVLIGDDNRHAGQGARPAGRRSGREVPTCLAARWPSFPQGEERPMQALLDSCSTSMTAARRAAPPSGNPNDDDASAGFRRRAEARGPPMIADCARPGGRCQGVGRGVGRAVARLQSADRWGACARRRTIERLPPCPPIFQVSAPFSRPSTSRSSRTPRGHPRRRRSRRAWRRWPPRRSTSRSSSAAAKSAPAISARP